MNGDPTKYPEWYKNYLRGIMQVESSGGNPDKFINPGSSATGMYQQLYKQVKDLPVMQGVDRQGFAADTALQNKVMGMRFLDDLPSVTGELRNARDLTERFQPQFGDKWNYRPDEVAAMTYFIGRQGTINYFNHLLKGGKPEDFKVSGNNMTVPKYMQVYNEGFGVEEEQPQERQISPELQNAIDIMKRDNRFGGRVLKKKNYGQNGMLVQKDPTLQQDPPQGTITPQEALMRALQPENQFRLTGGEAPFRPIKEQRDPVETLGKGIAEVVRMLPFAGEVIDTYELGKVAATGEDVYGQEQDPGLFAALTAAGYVIPNVLEGPLKSAWRAVKKFPSNMPKKEFRELMGPEKDQARANLIKGHLEVYGDKGYTESLSGARQVNVRQLPSLMSGSKLENAVGKDGMIQVSQIENLINSKDISEAERQALQEMMVTDRFKALRAAGGGSKVDYNSFRRLGSDAVTMRQGTGDVTFFVEESREMAGYGVDRLGVETVEGSPRATLIRTTDPDLQSTEHGHYGTDVIGHYRTFERPDEEGVLYISEMQSDPLQARGPEGKKQVSLMQVGKPITDDIAESHIQGFSKQSDQARLALAAIERGEDPSPFLDKMDVDVLYRTIDGVPYYSGTMRGDALGIQKTALGGRRLTSDSEDVSHTILNYKNEINPEAGIEKQDIDEMLKPILKNIIEDNDNYIKALKGGYRGGQNAKQANLIKNQDQFLISHILEQEAKGADKLRFPTGDTTRKIQGYGDLQRSVQRAERDLAAEQGALDGLMVDLDTMTGEDVPSLFAQRVEGMGLSGMDMGDTLDYLGRVRAARTRGGVPRDLASDPGIQYNQSIVEKFDNDALKLARKEFEDQASATGQKLNVNAAGFVQALQARANSIKTDIHTYSTYLERIKSQKEHLSRINASEQATQGIMKGYDRLPKALKKHGLDATKVTDDAGNTWWEVDIPARLGEGVGEIRAYRKGGQVSDKIRVLKKEGKPQDQAVAIALAMKQKGQL